MTATSVSITVATLQELGKLKSFLGTTIVSAAVIDDVIGIVVLTCVLGASGGADTSLVDVLMDTVLFFIAAIVIGSSSTRPCSGWTAATPTPSASPSSALRSALPWPTSLRLTSALQTSPGAYIAGIVLCTLEDAPYVERRVDISNYVIFAPIFFAPSASRLISAA